ncbi:MAG: 30S ribosomal protein S3ae [Candidatus Aenigmatarchaeota archaeon]
MLKKQWYEIVAPKAFEEKVVGETLANDPKQLIGRTIEVNVIDLLGDYSKFYFKIKFQAEKIEGSKIFTKFVGHECMRERVYRMVQRHVRRVDCIQDVNTKDGVKVRIKTIFVLASRVGTSLKDKSRKKAKEIVEKVVKEKTLDEFVKMIISGELQMMIKKDCSKIYPVGNVEIRKTEVLKEKKKAANE